MSNINPFKWVITVFTLVRDWLEQKPLQRKHKELTLFTIWAVCQTVLPGWAVWFLITLGVETWLWLGKYTWDIIYLQFELGNWNTAMWVKEGRFKSRSTSKLYSKKLKISGSFWLEWINKQKKTNNCSIPEITGIFLKHFNLLSQK